LVVVGERELDGGLAGAQARRDAIAAVGGAARGVGLAPTHDRHVVLDRERRVGARRTDGETGAQLRDGGLGVHRERPALDIGSQPFPQGLGVDRRGLARDGDAQAVGGGAVRLGRHLDGFVGRQLRRRLGDLELGPDGQITTRRGAQQRRARGRDVDDGAAVTTLHDDEPRLHLEAHRIVAVLPERRDRGLERVVVDGHPQRGLALAEQATDPREGAEDAVAAGFHRAVDGGVEVDREPGRAGGGGDRLVRPDELDRQVVQRRLHLVERGAEL
jgi:hypothetical protein